MITMKYTTRFTPHKPLGKLEAQKGRRYSYMDIAKVMNDDRQKVRYQLSQPISEIKTIMIDKWLTFFAAEGMPISVSDLFTVTEINDNAKG